MRILFAAFAVMAGASLCAAQDVAAQENVRVLAGFEKVHRDLKKKEAAAMKEIARANAETDASETLRLAGERQVADSDAVIETQKTAYKLMRERIGFATTSREAASEARALADIANIWADAEVSRTKGQKMVRQSEADAAKAVQRRLKGETKLAETRNSLSRTIDDSPAPIAASVQSYEEVTPIEATSAPTDEQAEIAPASIAVDDLPDAPASESPAPPEGLDGELLGGPDSSAPLKGQN